MANTFSTSKILFKSLEDGVPDVVMEPAERADHLPVRYFEALVEDYLQGSPYIHLDLRTGAELAEHISISDVRRAMRATDTHNARAGHLGSVEMHPIVRNIRHSDGYGAVLVPVICLVEEPESVLLLRTCCWIGTQTDDGSLNICTHMSEGSVPGVWRESEDRVRHVPLLIGRHVGFVFAGKRESEIIERTPHCFKSISDDEPQFVRESLELCANEFGSALAVGLDSDSVTLWADPVFCQTFGFPNMELRPSQLSTVTG